MINASLAGCASALWLFAATSCTSAVFTNAKDATQLERRWNEFEQEASAAANPESPKNDPQAEQADDTPWTFELHPSLWVPSRRGSTTVQGTTGPFVLSQLAAIVLHSELRLDRLSLFGDLYHLDLTESQTRDGERFTVDFKQVILELGAAYQVIDQDLGDGFAFTAAPLVGARSYYMDLRFRSQSGGSNSEEQAWVDGFGGARFRLGERDGLALVGRVDAGAGGSNATWNALAGLEWNIVSFLSLTAGYRWLSVDYARGSGANRFEYNVLQLGPTLGLSLRF